MHSPQLAVGTMTRAMRVATARPAPKVLRIGVAMGGVLVEERILKPRKSFAMFEHTKRGYVLVPKRGMTGRIIVRDRTIIVGESPIFLDESARGRVIDGTSTYLFQLVDAPPSALRPQLPLGVKKNALDIDWTLTILAALSFLLHFGFIGALYSDWTDAPVETGVDVGALVDLSPRIDARKTEDPQPALERPTPTQTMEPAETSQKPVKTGPPSLESLADQGEAMRVQMLLSFGGKSAIAQALDRSQLPIVNLDDAARSNTGARTDDVRTSNVTTFQNTHLSDLGVDRRDGEHRGTVRDVPITIEYVPPIGDPPVSSCTGADRTIALLRPSFRACYMRPSEAPDMEGKVTLSVKIGPNGEVGSVSKISGEGLSPTLEACVMQKMQNASFDPNPSGCTVQVPIIFKRQK